MDSELEIFIKEHCINCKNKETDLCTISRNINNELKCIYEEKRIGGANDGSSKTIL